jgi:hypothetical protein
MAGFVLANAISPVKKTHKSSSLLNRLRVRQAEPRPIDIGGGRLFGTEGPGLR